MDSSPKIAFDAKRYYHNRRGLGNYSRDVVRLLREYAPSFSLLLEDRGAIKRMFGAYPPCDIYHGLSGEIPMHRASCKRVVTIHDCIYRRYPELYSPTYRWLFDKKVAYACRHADLIVCISEQTREDVIRYYHPEESKLRVVYQGCNNIFRQPVLPEQVEKARARYDLPEQYVLIVGAIEPRKNLESLVRAVAKAGIDLPIVAVGAHTAYADHVSEVAAELSVRLLMRHDVNFQDFPAVYRGATLFAYPSLFEGFGIPILEAMCVGVPVLTSTGSCFSETGGDAALYAAPDDTDAMASQLSRIVSDADLRSQMVERGYRQAELFTDDRVAQHLIEMYQSLL